MKDHFYYIGSVHYKMIRFFVLTTEPLYIDLATEDIDQIVYEVVNAKAASEELSCKRAPKPIKRSPKKSAKTEN